MTESGRAKRGRGLADRQRAHAFSVEHEHLARLYVADEGSADGVEGAAFGGDDEGAVFPFAEAQGAEGVRVAHGDHLGRRHDDQRIGAPQAACGAADGLFDAGAFQSLLGDEIGDDLGIARRVEDGAPLFQLCPQGPRVGEVAVVHQGHSTILMIDHDGLGVAHIAAARGAVAHMPHGHVSPP